MLEITSFDDAARVVYRGSRGIEIHPDPKTVDYSPRKRPEMLEITGFDDAARVVYRGSRGIEILLGPENRGHSPRKRTEMHEITSFDDAARVVYREREARRSSAGLDGRFCLGQRRVHVN